MLFEQSAKRTAVFVADLPGDIGNRIPMDASFFLAAAEQYIPPKNVMETYMKIARERGQV